MKKHIVYLTLTVFVILNSSAVLAQEATPSPTTIKTLRQQLKERRNELKETLKSIVGIKKATRQDIKEKTKGKGIKIVKGTVTAISGTTLTVSKDSKSYTVLTDSNTKFRRHFWGKSSLAEISVGNKVSVFGKFTDDTQTTILAHLIRNLSVMKRNGVFFGNVTAKSNTSFTMDAQRRGPQTVSVDSSTKIVSRDEKVITYTDIQVGHRVRVKGLWDKSLSKMTEVTQIKDFSLPIKTQE